MAGWVLGCHRSGTSLLCSILRNLSTAHVEHPLGPDLPATPADPAGHYESVSLVEVNERLLGWAGCSWDRPFVARPAWEDPDSLELIARLQSPLSRHVTNVDWIDKDPRLCLTRDAFSHLLLRDPAAIAIMRHPLAVATSLHRRNGFSLRKGAAIWLLYNLHLFNSHSRTPETVLLFDDLVSTDGQVQARVARDLAAFSIAASSQELNTPRSSVEDRALSHLKRARRDDLVRSEDYRRSELDGPLVDKLTDIWAGCRELVRNSDAGHHEMASSLRNAWATVSPILEPEVAITLHESRPPHESRWFSGGIGKSLESLRDRLSSSRRRGFVGRPTQPSRPVSGESSAADASSPGISR